MGASRASECEPGDLVDCLVRWHVASSRERRTQKNELRDIRVVGLQLHWIRLIAGRVAARGCECSFAHDHCAGVPPFHSGGTRAERDLSGTMYLGGGPC